MLWAAATLCFFGFLRSGVITVPSDSEFDDTAHLTFRDVAIDRLQAPSMLRVRIKASKSDPIRVGVDVVVGKVDGPLCPVSALLGYLLVRGAGPGPLFRFEDGKPLTRIRLVENQAGREGSKGPSSGGCTQQTILGAQLPDWSCHYSCEGRSGGLHHQDAGKVEEQCLPALHQDA